MGKKKKGNTAFSCLAVLAVLAVLGVVSLRWVASAKDSAWAQASYDAAHSPGEAGKAAETTAQAAASAETERLKTAYYGARRKVLDQLVAPSTAKWSTPFQDPTGTGYMRRKDGIIACAGKVESKNRLGVPLRGEWAALVDDSSGECRLVWLKVDDQQIGTYIPEKK